MRVGRQHLIGLAVAGLVLALAAAALAATGSLTYRGCIANDAGDGCTPARHPSLGNNVGMAISTDGGSMYVATVEGTLTRLVRDPVTGSLVAKGCFAEDGRHRCHDIAHDSLNSATAVVMSSDDASVYVTSGEPTNAITRFARSESGRL